MASIVILDDQTTNRKIYERLARTTEEGQENRVHAFENPKDAIVWIEAGNIPDLVVTDYQMPDLNGASFIRIFRTLPGCEEIPVIVITAYEERSFRLDALEAGATDFLQSPVDHHEFRTRARNLLKLRRQHLILETRSQQLAHELAQSERFREAELRDSSERLAQVIDTVPTAIHACDLEGRIIFVNALQTELCDRSGTGRIGEPMETLLGEDKGARHRALDRKVMELDQALPMFEEEKIDQTGMVRVLLTSKTPLRDTSGRIVAVLTSSQDITERKRSEAHLRHMANHDSATGLPNRRALLDRLRRELARSRRGDRSFGLLFIDLDGFKRVNDALGHSSGDRVLRTVAQRLLTCAPNGSMVARIGGDEFAMVLTEITDRESAERMAGTIVSALGAPLAIGNKKITLGASIGISIHPSDASDIGELMRNADLAMYRAKAEGGECCRFWDSDMQGRASELEALDRALRNALAREEFELYYQPQFDVTSGRIIGAEALLRWNHPERGVVGPAEFLARAEENGMIVPINEWVLERACREAKSWQDRGLPPLRVAVNMSPIQFRRTNVPLLVAAALGKSGLHPHLLDLEITENMVMDDDESTLQQLRQLSELGVELSIDDFGTGYSSLHYLKRFPIKRLKIDQCFVRDVVNDPSDAAIVRAVISLGHSLELTVLAEGAETEEQVRLLEAEGCDELQGYYFGRPMPSCRFVDLIREGLASPATAAS